MLVWPAVIAVESAVHVQVLLGLKRTDVFFLTRVSKFDAISNFVKVTNQLKLWGRVVEACM